MATRAQQQLIENLVQHYRERIPEFHTFAKVLRTQILGSQALRKHINFVTVRVKAPGHLEDKLYRKLKETSEKGKPFNYSKKNLFVRINDLAALRIIHLHTQQIVPICNGLKALFEEERYRVIEGPTARIWDEEYRRFFREAGIATKTSKTLYTSVHYVLKPNRKTPITCELQIRTLVEEAWGEVDHELNYPHESDILACREQLAALARATWSCNRLIDAIYRTKDDADKRRGVAPRAAVQT
jgi:ppGpp synthetase/RelA/SpoT-type nucleotidyltranferase